MAGLIFLFGISGGEILVIMLLVLLLFGPSKIPEIARMLGRGMNEVKKVQREINTEIQRYSADVEKEAQKIKSDIQDLKKTIVETNDDDPSGDGAEKLDNQKGGDIKGDASKEGRAEESRGHDDHAGDDMEAGSPYEYDYDQYGLDDPYGTSFGKTGKTASADTKKESRSPESTTSLNAESSPEEVLNHSDSQEDIGAGNDKNQGDKQDARKQEEKEQGDKQDARKQEEKEQGDKQNARKQEEKEQGDKQGVKKQGDRKQQSPVRRKKKTPKNPGGDNL